MSTDSEIHVSLTRAEYRRGTEALNIFVLHRARPRWSYRIFRGMLMATFVMPMIFLIGISANRHEGAAIFYISSVVSIFALLAIDRKRQRYIFDRLPPKPDILFGPKRYALVDGGISSTSEFGTSILPWAHVSGIQVHEDLLLVIIQDYAAEIFPRRVFRSDAQFKEIVEFISSRAQQAVPADGPAAPLGRQTSG